MPSIKSGMTEVSPGRGCNRSAQGINQPAAVRAACTPKLKADRPVGQWNRFIITMRGDRVTVVLNERTVIENAQLPDVPTKGSIGLQHHGDPMQFANIFIRELK